MSQKQIVKNIQAQALSGSTPWLDVSDMELSRGTVAYYSNGTSSGSFELQGTFDQNTVFTIYGVSGSTGAGAAVALKQAFGPNYATAPSASYPFVRLSNARFATFAMGGAMSASFMAPPFLPSP